MKAALRSLATFKQPSDLPTTMKIRLFIVTYKRREKLAETLSSLLAGIGSNQVDLFIINNHDDFHLDPAHAPFVRRVFHNQTRAPFSTGHLARNWNEAIILGFESLKSPACDLLITSQDDVEFRPGWLDRILTWSDKLSFMQFGAGDELCVYRPQAVTRTGLWDERYCHIGFQEADYFLRCVMHNPESSSINDFHHGRVYNPLENMKDEGLVVRLYPEAVKHSMAQADPVHAATYAYDLWSGNVFRQKYGRQWRKLAGQWPAHIQSIAPKRFRIPTYAYYPYFEKDIRSPLEKGYPDLRRMYISPFNRFRMWIGERLKGLRR
jgi:hypothetical protein